jgi:predicted flavoprotein YhiN
LVKAIDSDGVKFHYRHRCVDLSNNQLTIENQTQQFSATYDAIVLACGAVSWSQLGSDGAWQQWLSTDEIEPFQASNAGVLKQWSPFMQDCFGQPLKRVDAWVNTESKTHGDIIITHYGFESGVIYKLGRDLRTQLAQQQLLKLHLDLLPDLSIEQLEKKLQGNKSSLLPIFGVKQGWIRSKLICFGKSLIKAYGQMPSKWCSRSSISVFL